MSTVVGDFEIETNYNEIVKDFEDLNLKSDLLRGIFSYGYEKPSAIQARAIKPCIEARDVLAQAQSGTGKTATFTISALQRIDTEINAIQSLILVPTRELAKQIQTVVQKIGCYLNVLVHLCVGGTRPSDDASSIRNGCHVIVGTPGRVLHMLNERVFGTNDLKVFVLDEADEMLSRGFCEQISEIYRYLPESTQILLFSATMPTEIEEVTNEMMRNPVKILVKKEELTLDGIRQFYVKTPDEADKLGVLKELYQLCSVSQVVIFINTINKVNSLYESLSHDKYCVACIHGQMDQADRYKVLQDFRNGSNRVLLATDVLARGIDVQQVSLVINYDLPTNRETYIHRIGRGGRFGRKGTAINLLGEGEDNVLHQLMEYYNTTIVELPENVADFI